MGVEENIAAVRADAGTHAQNFFIYFFKKFPQYQKKFVNFKDKDVNSLKSVATFPSHTGKVVDMLLGIIERSGDAGALKADAQKIKTMPQHAGLGIQAFKDLFSALVPFLEDTLGATCDSAGFTRAGGAILTALQAAGLH